MAEPKYSPIIRKQLEGLKTFLTRAFGVRDPVITLSNSPLEYYLRRAATRVDQQGKNQNIKYPFTYVAPKTIALYKDGYNAAFAAKSPVARRYAQSQDDSRVLNGMAIVPMLLTLEFGYITDDAMKFLEFASHWVFLSKSGQVDFGIEYEGVRMDIQVHLSESVDIPEKDMAIENLNQGGATAQIELYGYTATPPEMMDKTVQITSIVGPSVTLTS